MNTLQNMRFFARVAEAGSFTEAARHLDTTTGAVSRAVSDLEIHLRTRLLNRTTRRIALTGAGERYRQHCEHILRYIGQAEAEAAGAHVRPAGQPRVHSATGFGQYYVVPAVVQYQERYPSVSVDLTLSQLPDSGLISQRLGESSSILCAAPAYLEKRGTPLAVENLKDHVCLQITTPFFPLGRWQFEGPNGEETFTFPTARFNVNVADALAAALRAGMGIGALPISTALPALSNGTLVPVLHDYYLQKMTIYALFASRHYVDAKIRTWIDFLQEHVPAMLQADLHALNELRKKS
ncbi:LysR family transcriptional regulator [Paraburkholderia strydomiana]|uniref:LysR family transcriptional regulator n=1 Tax=Paraburkholderia strydomiana TaxID=1245417 RepID=UPI0038BC9ECE